ncbi:RHS repeat-associated core domain-containing protein [Prevotella sp. SGI.027]
MNGKVIEERSMLYTSYKDYVKIPFLFQGQYYDNEIKLAYNRFRYYSPEIGRYISEDPIRFAYGIVALHCYVEDCNGWVDVLGLRPLTLSEIKALDDHLLSISMTDAKKGVYNFTNADNLNYTGSAGTGQGTNTIRDRLLQHMRNDHLKVDNLDSLKVVNMNHNIDSEVLMKEATTIKEHGGIGNANVANRRRPKGTGYIAKK